MRKQKLEPSCCASHTHTVCIKKKLGYGKKEKEENPSTGEKSLARRLFKKKTENGPLTTTVNNSGRKKNSAAATEYSIKLYCQASFTFQLFFFLTLKK